MRAVIIPTCVSTVTGNTRCWIVRKRRSPTGEVPLPPVEGLHSPEKVDVQLTEEVIGRALVNSTGECTAENPEPGPLAQNIDEMLSEIRKEVTRPVCRPCISSNIDSLTTMHSNLNVPALLAALENYPDKVLSRRLADGFQFGFKVGYSGERRPRVCKNSKTATARPTIVKEMIQKEVDLGRYVGPFDHPPIPNLTCSPIALVPKGDKFRMINNLSYPRGDSINDAISDADAATQYERFDRAIDILLKQGKGAVMFKADIKSAFRNIPIHPDDFCLFGVQFDSLYYVDRNMFRSTYVLHNIRGSGNIFTVDGD